MEAAASMPLAAKIVKIGHYGLLDGGVADSIPVRFFESIGYKRNLIIPKIHCSNHHTPLRLAFLHDNLYQSELCPF